VESREWVGTQLSGVMRTITSNETGGACWARSSITGPLLCPPVVPAYWRLPAAHASVPRARHLVAEALEVYLLPGQEASDELSDSLSLMTSELVTNAVTHAPTEDRFVEVTLWRADGMLWLAVSDCGEVFPARRCDPADPVAPAYPDQNDDHGRGLYLVAALAEYWTVLPRPTVGKSVVAGLRLP